MVRPRKVRRVAFLPGVTYFKPQGIPLRHLDEVRIGVDEVEALRLRSLEGLDQEEAASRMGVSRQTFQRVLEEAYRKVAEGIILGKALRIEGGDYEQVPLKLSCRHCGHSWEQTLAGSTEVACPRCDGVLTDFVRGCRMQTEKKEDQKMTKIAVVSDDGKTVSAHFGRAELYVVVTAEEAKVTGREVRPKVAHGHGHAGGHGPHEEHGQADGHGPGHGFDPASEDIHTRMAGSIDDCQVVLAGGMGFGAFESLKARGLNPIITDIRDIDQAAQAYLDGTIRNLTEKLH
ncbi:MAG TPA: DUF134 domain-containing protein [Bacillota bacterium]